MRARPLDFLGDLKVAELRGEYVFGPRFLAAPIDTVPLFVRAGFILR
jgi:alpha-glucosidase (family GH31 glycosyl hydrolase)